MNTAIKVLATSGAITLALIGALPFNAQPASMDCAAIQAEPARPRAADMRAARATALAGHREAPPRRPARKAGGDVPLPLEDRCGPNVFGSLPPKCFRNGKYIIADGYDEGEPDDLEAYDPEPDEPAREPTLDEKWGPLL